MKRTSLYALMWIFAMTACAMAQNPALVTEIHSSTDESVGIMNCRGVLNGVVYFNGNDGSGQELWRTDGTASGTYRVKDVPGTATAGGIQGGIFTRNGHLYFNVSDGVDGADPWISDGTEAGTFALTSQSRKKMSKFVENYVALGSNVYFIYYFIEIKPNMTTNVLYELWGTDGTQGGTSMVTSSCDWIQDIVSNGNLLFMHAKDSYGLEPWRSDGSDAGTYMILDICQPGPVSCGSNYAATTLRQSFYDSHKYPLTIGNTFYFSKGDQHVGEELWRSDGTAGGTISLTDINPGNGHACPQFLTEANGILYFTADDGIHGMELYKYPLPNGPATLVKDIVPGGGASEPIWLTPINEILYFSAWTETGGRELWRSDGTATGTYQVFDIAPASLSSNPMYDRLKDRYDPTDTGWRQFTVINGRLYFAADDGNGYELWESDGTATGTMMIADVNPNPGEGSTPRYLSVLGDRLLFMAYHPNHGNEWWVYHTSPNLPPTVTVSATPLTGDAPLSVSFSSAGSIDLDGVITSWYWDFGDEGTSPAVHPTHVYQNPGTYTATLTVTDDDFAQASASVTIDVTSTLMTMHVESQTVIKYRERVNKLLGQDLVLIYDADDQPVEGAVVHADYYGPTSGSTSGTTDANGEVTLETKTIRYSNDHWCFTVTNVQKAGYLFDPTIGVVGPVCSTAPAAKSGAQPAASGVHLGNHPNPFKSSTIITYSIPEDGYVKVVVSDILGREIAHLADGHVATGQHHVTFDGSRLPVGWYLCHIETAGTTRSKRMLLLK